jgi:RNA polymerase sigma factor (sigma-70 family)
LQSTDNFCNPFLNMSKNNQIHNKIDHLFRREYGKICASLTRRFGIKNLQVIEDAVQDALIKAMQVWGFTSIPANPSAWLYKVAANRALDILKRDKKSSTFGEETEIILSSSPNQDNDDWVDDSLLEMIFATCHPCLSPTEQILLSLKLLCGFNVQEISRALVRNNESVKKSLTRAKNKIRNLRVEFSIPEEVTEQKQRLENVLRVVYLMFNEGYKATAGNTLMREDVCEEAVRLANILQSYPKFDLPEVNALLALMCFNLSRFSTRQDSEMQLITLEFQDRRLWDKNYINMAVCFLRKSARGENLSKYHLEAAIASLYIIPKKYADTNWAEILRLYNLLIISDFSLSAKLNRIVVLAKVNGAGMALKELSELYHDYPKIESHTYFAIKADLEIQIGDVNKAIKSLNESIIRANNEIEKKFLRNKRTSLLN